MNQRRHPIPGGVCVWYRRGMDDPWDTYRARPTAKARRPKGSKAPLTTTERVARRRAQRADRMAGVKNGPCMDCGGTFPVVCMDLDHRDPDDKDRSMPGVTGPSNMSRAVGWSKVLAEIQKCDLVCANCHRLRTATRLGWAGTAPERDSGPRS